MVKIQKKKIFLLPLLNLLLELTARGYNDRRLLRSCENLLGLVSFQVYSGDACEDADPEVPP